MHFVLVALGVLLAGGLSADAQPREIPIPRAKPLKAGPSPAAQQGALSALGQALRQGTEPAAGLEESGDEMFMEGEGDLSADGEGLPEDGVGGPLDLAPDAVNGADTASGIPGAAPLDLGPQTADAPREIDPSAPLATFSLDAKLTEEGMPITAGMTWRVFSATPEPDGKLRLVGEARGGPVSLKLRPGTYFVHAAYGRAGVTRRVTIGRDFDSGTIVLNAGGMRLSAMVGKDQPLNGDDVRFDIYAPDEGGSTERVLVVPDADQGRVIGLNAGTYHVVSRYGDANAVVRADIRVEAGKVTDATVFQKAARLTLKLVESPGGEALANTSWSVMTPGGDSVADFVGAFPSVVLAIGDYTAVARHNGALYERTFTVEAGVNRDVEVLLKR